MIRLHVLHRAAKGEIYGNSIMEELRRDGFRISPGTLYPLLHDLERSGYVSSRRDVVGRRGGRRFYRATPKGRRALAAVRDKVRELLR